MTKNITLSADDFLIQQARKKALRENTSLNQLFRSWVIKYVNRDQVDIKFETLMADLSDIKAGQKFSRDEMNDR